MGTILEPTRIATPEELKIFRELSLARKNSKSVVSSGTFNNAMVKYPERPTFRRPWWVKGALHG